MSGQRTCRGCGCTDRQACPGGCCWVEDDLCSACAEEDAPCPDNRFGQHQPLYRGDGSAYCVDCRAELES